MEIHYSLLGNECILINGEKISERPSLAKKPHSFVLGKNTYSVSSRVDLIGTSGRNFTIRKNGDAISLVNFKTENSKALLVLTIVVGLGVSYFLGAFLMQLL